MAQVKRDHAQDLERLIALWDRLEGDSLLIAPERHGTNVAMVNAFASHSVNLARGVLAMHRAGLDFESISLVRSTMECTVTAAWHALYPDKTADFLAHSASERGKVLKEIAKVWESDDTTALDQVNALLEKHTDPIHREAKWLQARFESMAGGDRLYTIYRALCTWDHATNSLADAYTTVVPQGEENPWGLVLSASPINGKGGNDWVGIEVGLVLRAQLAADMILTKPRHKTQLANWARQLGVSPDITPADTARS